MSDIVRYHPCGHEYSKKWVKREKQYYCTTCSINHIFSFLPIQQLAPFSSLDEASIVQKEMRQQLIAVSGCTDYYTNLN